MLDFINQYDITYTLKSQILARKAFDLVIMYPTLLLATLISNPLVVHRL